ncbi:MAG: hypothetical protein AAF078_07420 [Planctomycetota bacterium]
MSEPAQPEVPDASTPVGPADPTPDPPTHPPTQPALPRSAPPRWLSHAALLITFTVGAALGLALGPAGGRHAMSEPMRSALGPVPADLAAQRDAFDRQADELAAALRATGVSDVAIDEALSEAAHRTRLAELDAAWAKARGARELRLTLAALWALGVVVFASAMIVRTEHAGRRADEVWHWGRHAGALALGFVALIWLGYYVNP